LCDSEYYQILKTVTILHQNDYYIMIITMYTSLNYAQQHV